MKLNKYSESKEGSTIIGSYSDQTSSVTQSSNQITSGTINRDLWGQRDTGDDIEGDIKVSGNIFCGEIKFDEDEMEEYDEEVPSDYDHEFPEEYGCIYAEKEIHGHELYLDIDDVKTNLLDLLMPVGSIIMFNGKSEIPANWAVCDGSNGTPNLKDKFIKGVTSSSEVGKTGGSATKSLSVDEMPSHNHSATTTIGLDLSSNSDVPTSYKNKYIPALDKIEEDYFDHGGSSNAIMYTGNKIGDYGLIGIKVTDLVSYAGASGSASASTTIGYKGKGSSFNIEPPYYTLIYIMRIK